MSPGAAGRPRPERRPVGETRLPRPVLLSFSLGAGLLVAGLLLIVLQLAGVESVGPFGWLGVVLVAAVAGGLVARSVVPRIPVRDDGPPPGS